MTRINLFCKLIAAFFALTVCIGLVSCDSSEDATEKPTQLQDDTEKASEKSTEKLNVTEKPTEKETEMRKQITKNESIVTLNIDGTPQTRDPSVIYHNGKYYVYSTGWKVSVSKTDDFRDGFFAPNVCVEYPEDYAGDPWAPEVHIYNGKFYMFTTYRSTKNNHRGCAIFASDSPEGPFELYSDGHVTPNDWDAIDGTLYVDKDGQPWMIFVHEWTGTEDGMGRMSCAKLSADLKQMISEPVDIFRADDAPWSIGVVTDGCYVYENIDGSLFMIWSSHSEIGGGYSVGLAISENGNVTGPWKHYEELLFSKNTLNKYPYDGGHGMIFTDKDGYMWMSIHSPNSSNQGRNETPVLIPLCETSRGMLVWDEYERK